jgi:nitroreductase
MIKHFLNRVAGYPINDFILSRWSPRAFTPNTLIPQEEIFSIIEAGRWAQSSGNSQPWKYYVTQNGSSGFQGFLDCLDVSNAEWCKNASLLICLVVEKEEGKIANKFDFLSCGLSAQNVTYQAQSFGYQSHYMAGFDEDNLQAFLNLSPNQTICVVIALGKQGHKSVLSEKNQERELPSLRKPITDIYTLI